MVHHPNITSHGTNISIAHKKCDVVKIYILETLRKVPEQMMTTELDAITNLLHRE